MKNTIKYIAPVLLVVAVGSANAATIQYDFDDNDGIVDSNDFGAGVTVSDFTLVSSGGTSFGTGRADIGTRNASNGPATMSFDVIIDDTVTVDLSGITFDHGFVQTNTLNFNALYTLTATGGTVAPTGGTIPTLGAAGHTETGASHTLSGLTGLTDTTVTFLWTFTNDDNRANTPVVLGHTMDDLVLTGTVAAVPEPSSAALLGLGGLALILRRRK